MANHLMRQIVLLLHHFDLRIDQRLQSCHISQLVRMMHVSRGPLQAPTCKAMIGGARGKKLAGLLPRQDDLLYCQTRLIHRLGLIFRHSLPRTSPGLALQSRCVASTAEVQPMLAPRHAIKTHAHP